RQQTLLRERVRLLLGERLEPRYRHVPVETPQDLSQDGYIRGRVAGSSQIVGPVVEGGRSPVLIAVGVGRRRRNTSQILGDSDDLILRGEAPIPGIRSVGYASGYKLPLRLDNVFTQSGSKSNSHLSGFILSFAVGGDFFAAKE